MTAIDYNPKTTTWSNAIDQPFQSCVGGSCRVRTIPCGYNIVGTCGSCGGPLLSPISIAGGDYEPVPFCQDCGKHAKKIPQPIYGPIREMV